VSGGRWRLLAGLMVAGATAVAIGAGALGASGAPATGHTSADSVHLGIEPASEGRYSVNVATQASLAAQDRVCVDLYRDSPVTDDYLLGACTTTGFAGGHSITFTVPASALADADPVYAKVSLLDSPGGTKVLTSNKSFALTVPPAAP
jgi:hypothetical protein